LHFESLSKWAREHGDKEEREVRRGKRSVHKGG